MFEDNNENILLTKSSAESDSIFQMKGSKAFEKNKQKRTNMFKLLWLIWESKQVKNKQKQRFSNYFS